MKMSELIVRMVKVSQNKAIAEAIALKILGAEEIRVEDYSSYCPYRCFNGGQYLFKTIYRRKDDGNFAVIFTTTAEFSYCSIFGQFQDCWNCPDYDREKETCTLDYQECSPFEVLESFINDLEGRNQVRWIVNNEEVVIDCEEHQPGWCSLCQTEVTEGCYLCL